MQDDLERQDVQFLKQGIHTCTAKYMHARTVGEALSFSKYMKTRRRGWSFFFVADA
jgi:hypothetical protein